MIPSVGRIVHYHRAGYDGPLAALITYVAFVGGDTSTEVSYAVHLEVHHPSEGPWLKNYPVPFAAEPTTDHWNWPPRV